MNKSKRIINISFFVLIIFLSSIKSFAQTDEFQYQKEIFWQVNKSNSIVWNLTGEKRLPHHDNIEMDGQLVATIIHYEVDENKALHISRDVYFPQLKRLLKTNDPEYMNYRAYLNDTYRDDLLPVISTEGNRFVPGDLDSVIINGKINFYHHSSKGIQLVRTIFPSTTERVVVEKWTLTNTGTEPLPLNIGNTLFEQKETGVYGLYTRTVTSDAMPSMVLMPSKSYTFGIYFKARLNNEPEVNTNVVTQEKGRDDFLSLIKANLIVETPNKLINTLFYFSKIRAAESIYQTKMGLVHSPGGSNYYTGVWANDQGEYSGPFFPYLGYGNGVVAAMNAYRKFLQNIPKGDEKIWASFEMNGELPCCSRDRGDAAMLAFGAAHFCLATGKHEFADTLWPLIEWGLGYCEKKKTVDGVIASVSDELEGRFPSGSANLSTSSLYYGALLLAADLAKATDKPQRLIADYLKRAEKLSVAIEKYFGAEMDGLHTYKYYKENTTLRSWICLPLVMGINQRKEGTLDALFNKLWNDNGVRTELTFNDGKPVVFWDRGTLYSFRSAFKAGAADRALEKLVAFSTTRLTGFHVPYVVEAWPEYNMQHLSAESALYCRIFTEGILGLMPKGFHSFTLQPNLPGSWSSFSIKKIAAFNSNFDILLNRVGMGWELIVQKGDVIILKKQILNGELVKVDLSN